MQRRLQMRYGGAKFALLLAIILILPFTTATVWADTETVIDSGTCGTNLTWTLTETDDTMTLTISGSGSMDDYSSSGSVGDSAPWYDYRQDINEAIIENGVSTIGMWAFSQCTNMQKISLPDSLRTIKNYSFSRSGLKHVTIPNGVTSIKYRAFVQNNSLESIVFPSSVKAEQYDTRYSLDCCVNLKYIFYGGSQTQWSAYGFGIANAANPEQYVFPDAVVHYNSTDHTYVHVDQIDATATENGMREHYECSVCGALFEKNGDAYTETTEEELIIESVHRYGDLIEQVDATCENDGIKAHYKCSICGKLFVKDGETYIETTAEELVIQGGHKFSEWATIQPATCTDTGSEERTCSVCESKETREVGALGHDLIHHDAQAATCTEAGWDAYDTCSRCDYTTYAEIPAKDHDWSNWTDKQPATSTEAGIQERTCSRCGNTETRPAPGTDPNQKGKGGSPVGEGASAAAAEKAITNITNDSDPKGAEIGRIQLRSPKQTKTSITLKWTSVKGATHYVIYGNKCGKGIRPKYITTVKGKTKTLKKIGVKVRAGKYYKMIVVALDADENVVSTSKLIHVASKGGKAGNYKSVSVSKKVVNKAKALKKGKSLKLGAKAVPLSSKKKPKRHVAMRYESSDKSIATVSPKGVIKAVGKKGETCYVYAYAQNGVFKKIKVVVK